MTNFEALLSSLTKHTVAESTKLIATDAGSHIYNGVATVDLDNGTIVTLGDYQANDYYAVAAPTGFAGHIVAIAANGNYIVHVDTAGDGYLVLTAPKSYLEDKVFSAEDQFYNKAGEIMRLYQLTDDDEFTVSEAAFTNANPAVGQSVTVNSTSFKLVNVAG